MIKYKLFISILKDKIETADKYDTYSYSPSDILLSRDIAYINQNRRYTSLIA